MELRFRKLTLTNVKGLCPLVRQMKVSVDQKINYLQSLIDFQLKMSDYAELIYMFSRELLVKRELLLQLTKKIEWKVKSIRQHYIVTEDSNTCGSVTLGDLVVGVFTDDYYPGEVVAIEETYVDFLVVV